MEKSVECIFKINEVLKKCNLSDEGYDSTSVGFFQQDTQKKLFEVDFNKMVFLSSFLSVSI